MISDDNLKNTGVHENQSSDIQLQDVYDAGGINFQVPTHYAFIKSLGSGSYGVVGAFLDKQTNTKVAVKKVCNIFEEDCHMLSARICYRGEVRILRQCWHRNIIRMLDLYVPSLCFENLYIVTELMETDLHMVIHSTQKLTDAHLQHILFQILLALDYLHHHNVMHRDVKPRNVLLNRDCDVKLCDFGLARSGGNGLGDSTPPSNTGFQGDELSHGIVSLWYRAPEILLGQQYTQQIDIWSTGCVLGEIFGQRPLFPGSDDQDMLKRILSVTGMVSKQDIAWLSADSPALKSLESDTEHATKSWKQVCPAANNTASDLLAKMLHFDPHTRISARDTLLHQFFEGYEGLNGHQELQQNIDLSFDLRGTAELRAIPTEKQLLQNLIYAECAVFHPEILECDMLLRPAALARGNHVRNCMVVPDSGQGSATTHKCAGLQIMIPTSGGNDGRKQWGPKLVFMEVFSFFLSAMGKRRSPENAGRKYHSADSTETQKTCSCNSRRSILNQLKMSYCKRHKRRQVAPAFSDIHNAPGSEDVMFLANGRNPVAES